MMETLYFLALIGTFVVFIIGISIAHAAITNCIKYCKNKKYAYRYRRKSGRMPRAKCYCRDCRHWCEEDFKCYKNYQMHKVGIDRAEDEFCCNAVPIKDPFEQATRTIRLKQLKEKK